MAGYAQLLFISKTVVLKSWLEVLSDGGSHYGFWLNCFTWGLTAQLSAFSQSRFVFSERESCIFLPRG